MEKEDYEHNLERGSEELKEVRVKVKVTENKCGGRKRLVQNLEGKALASEFYNESSKEPIEGFDVILPLNCYVCVVFSRMKTASFFWEQRLEDYERSCS